MDCNFIGSTTIIAASVVLAPFFLSTMSGFIRDTAYSLFSAGWRLSVELG